MFQSLYFRHKVFASYSLTRSVQNGLSAGEKTKQAVEPVAILSTVAVLLLGLDLRPAVTSIGTLLEHIRLTTGMPASLAALIVATPVWCFALGGLSVWAVRKRWGITRPVYFLLSLLAVSLAFRVFGSPYVLWIGTISACLSIALLGALLPSIVQSAPVRQRRLLVTCYTVALGAGSAIGALLTPLLESVTTWRISAGMWALLPVAALLIWGFSRRTLTDPPLFRNVSKVSPFSLRPRSVSWSLTVHFGLLTGFSFAIMGWLPSILDDFVSSKTDVSWMFGIAMTVPLPIALVLPTVASRCKAQSALVVLFALPSVVGTAGLLLLPAAAPWLWAICVGLGMTTVLLALTLLQLRAGDADGIAALSTLVNGFGYALAGAVTFGVGLLHALSASWQWPLIALLVVLCGQIVTGIIAGRPIVVTTAKQSTLETQAARESSTIMIAVSTALNSPQLLSPEKKKHFQDEGLEIHVCRADCDSDCVAQLLTGQADVAFTSEALVDKGDGLAGITLIAKADTPTQRGGLPKTPVDHVSTRAEERNGRTLNHRSSLSGDGVYRATSQWVAEHPQALAALRRVIQRTVESDLPVQRARRSLFED